MLAWKYGGFSKLYPRKYWFISFYGISYVPFPKLNVHPIGKRAAWSCSVNAYILMVQSGILEYYVEGMVKIRTRVASHVWWKTNRTNMIYAFDMVGSGDIDDKSGFLVGASILFDPIWHVLSFPQWFHRDHCNSTWSKSLALVNWIRQNIETWSKLDQI